MGLIFCFSIGKKASFDFTLERRILVRDECICEHTCACMCVHWLWVQRVRGAHLGQRRKGDRLFYPGETA